MRRYATELSAALQSICGDEWQVQELVCHQVGLAARLVPGKPGQQLASRLGRFIKYPIQASRVKGDVFHVLDHSHANLTLALDPRKTVITCHDIIPLLASRGEIAMDFPPLTRYTFPVRLRCLKRCAYIITDSESTKGSLVKYANIPEERIKVALLGVKKIFSRAETSQQGGKAALAIRSKYGLPQDAKVIMHLSTKARYKNSPALLKALGVLNRQPGLNSQVWLLRVGQGFFQDEQKLIEKLGIADRIVSAGRTADDEALAELYQGSDVFAFPSLWEGFGWPPLEAMACGTPVVSSNAASLPEVVGDAGLMVEPNDYEGLAKALKAVLTNPSLRQSLSMKGRLRAQQFTWERTAQKTLEVYEQIVQDGRRNRR